MKQLTKLGAVIGLVLLAIIGCDPPGDDRFWITNPTDDSLYYFQGYEQFPLPDQNPFTPYDEHNFYPYERRNFKLGTGKWDGIITSNSPVTNTILFYTFDKKIVDTTPWSVIRTRKLYKLYELRLTELRGQNWQIILTDQYRSQPK